MGTPSLSGSSTLFSDSSSSPYVAELSEVCRILTSAYGPLGENLRMGDIPEKVRREIIDNRGEVELVQYYFNRYTASLLSELPRSTTAYH